MQKENVGKDECVKLKSAGLASSLTPMVSSCSGRSSSGGRLVRSRTSCSSWNILLSSRYPILDLRPDRCDVHRYVRDLEDVLIRTAAAFGITAARATGLTGAWVGDEKLAAIGVRIARWVTSHGFALNVSTNLSHFGLIVPCGISDKGVTSMEKLLGRPVPMPAVEDAVIDAFSVVFDRRALATHLK